MRQVLRSMDQQDRDRLTRVLEYPPDTASGLMNTDTVTVRADVPLEAVLRYLRMRGELPEPTDRLFVVDRADRYLGALPLTRLLTADPGSPVHAQMDPEAAPIPPDMPADEVAALFESRDLLSTAVVSAEGKLLSRITVDYVVDVVREQAEHASLAAAGLEDEEDVFAGVRKSARRRALWLGINLVTALFASWVVGLFEVTIQKVVALAVLMPVVASMGGIAGTQTVTLIIRAIAVGQVQPSNARWLFFKELGVGALNGFAWATVVALTTWLWFGTWEVAAVIFHRDRDQPGRRSDGGRPDPDDPEAASHRPGTRRRRDPDDRHRRRGLRGPTRPSARFSSSSRARGTHRLPRGGGLRRARLPRSASRVYGDSNRR